MIEPGFSHVSPIRVEPVRVAWVGLGRRSVKKPCSGATKVHGPLMQALAALLLAAGVAHSVPAVAQATPVLLGTASRKVHGGAGTFDLALGNVASNPTTEPRFGPTHMLVFTFDGVVTAATVAVTEGAATSGTPTFNGSELIVPLTAVGNAQYVTVTVGNVATAGGTGGGGSIRVGFLAGDVNQNRVVSLADLGLVNAMLAQPVTAANYLGDVNASGTLSLADKGLVNVSLATALPLPAATGLFEKPQAWNTDVSALAASSRSPAILAALTSFGGWGNGNRLQVDFAITLLDADSQTPRRTITASPSGYCYNGPDCDAVPLQMPLPANGNTEGSADYNCDTANEDCHVLVVEHTEKKLYELYNATAAGSNFTALGAFVWDLTKQYGDVLRGDQCTSADAAGLPMAALLPTADEVAAGEVAHALRFILPNNHMKKLVYVRPATHAGGPSNTNADAPPYGVRFRLKSGFNEAPYNANARVILDALKKYGMILSDGGNIALTFGNDRLATAKWATLGIDSHTFFGLAVSDFEVVDLGAEIALTDNCVRAP
jgi:hypothetical protein